MKIRGNCGKGVRLVVCVAMLVSAMGIALKAPADCGSVPYMSPIEPLVGIGQALVMMSSAKVSDKIKFDPAKVKVYEPGQRAIILWNGQEEILHLSTQIRTSEQVSLLEVIPFPSEPTVKLGDFETFNKMENIIIKKKMWRVAAGGGMDNVEAAAKITFQKKMGAHDIYTVNVLNKDYFVQWVNDFFASKQAINAQLRPELVKIIENYLERGFRWFVFDSIQTDTHLKNKEPLEFRFATDALYYPLEISSLETGKTNIDLTLVTTKKLTEFSKVRFASDRDSDISISRDELAGVLPYWARFMSAKNMTVQKMRIKGNIRKLKTDLFAH